MQIDIQTNMNEWTATLSGNVTHEDRNHFKILIHCFKDASVEKLIIDFEKIGQIQSSAIGALLLIRDEAIKHDADIILKNVNGNLLVIFEQTVLSDLFTVH